LSETNIALLQAVGKIIVTVAEAAVVVAKVDNKEDNKVVAEDKLAKEILAVAVILRNVIN
jgi:hypothetical protein